MPKLYDFSSGSVQICAEGALGALRRLPAKVRLVTWIPCNSTANDVLLHIDDTEGLVTCVVDLGGLLVSDNVTNETLWLGLNILSLSSLAMFDRSVDPNDLTQYEFLKRALNLFNDDMHTLKSAVGMPPLALFSRDGHLSNKDSKKLLETYFSPESGFSEDIGNRNLIRNITTSMFESRELISAHADNSIMKEILSIESVRSRLSRVMPMEFGGVGVNGPILASLLLTCVQDGAALQGPLVEDVRVQIEEDLLLEIEKTCYASFTTRVSIERSNSSSAPSKRVGMGTLSAARRSALQEHSAHINKWTAAAISSKKSLQRRIRADMRTHEAVIREALTAHCRQVLEGFSVPLGGSSREEPAASVDFRTLKSSIEKHVSTYNSLTVTSDVVAIGDTGQALSECAYSNQAAADESLEALRSELLREMLMHTLKDGLHNCELWIQGFTDMVTQSERKRTDMQNRHTSLQEESKELDDAITTHKRVAAETLRALTTTLGAGRKQQSSDMERLESEVQGLVDAVERSSRLNEKEKAELSEDLMDIQKRVQVAQGKALELRQQREEQANELHQSLLENEREGHKWMKATYAKQHDLLSEELQLERELNQKKSGQMAELFAMESAHIKKVEGMRNMSQREIQAIREDHFKRRDILARDRDATVSMLRRRNIELEAKLNAAGGGIRGQSSDTDKGCSVM